MCDLHYTIPIGQHFFKQIDELVLLKEPHPAPESLGIPTVICQSGRDLTSA